MVQRPNLLYSEIYQKGNWKKEYTISSGTAKSTTSQAASSSLGVD